jgi:general secretion pathway protein J
MSAPMNAFARANTTNRADSGFTLLEVMVAVALFAILAAVAFGGLTAIARAQVAVKGKTQALDQLSFALSRIEKDLAQALPRSIRSAYGQPEAALVGDAASITVSTLVLASDGQPSLTAVRVRHSWGNSRWLRSQFLGLDLAPSTPESARLVLTGFNSVKLSYFDAQLREFERWPPPNRADLPQDTLPRAVELRFKDDNVGEIRRLFFVSDAVSRP